MANKKKKPVLTPEVAEKYKLLTGHGAGEYYYNGHKVNLTEINLAQADELVANKFPFLVLKTSDIEKLPENSVTP